jgi:hypothetical protein
MTVQYSVSLRNAKLNAIPDHIGASAILKIRTGNPPANVAAADSGTVLATVETLSTYFGASSNGSIAKTGDWIDVAADADGEAGHFRLYENDGTTCHMQGTVTEEGDGGDMILNTVNIEAGQSVEILSFTLTSGNA